MFIDQIRGYVWKYSINKLIKPLGNNISHISHSFLVQNDTFHGIVYLHELLRVTISDYYFYVRWRHYTTTEQELLSIVETLKEFRNILLGQRIKVFTDHKNLVHESELKTSQRVMRWRLLLEEYGPEIEYIKGPKNVVADALSRPPKQGD